ncbi:hypothetical protein CI102_9133 [Trichoderma harzianum]|nr:hypothetical protein CI102_9133 [Trichoderma harzianum]
MEDTRLKIIEEEPRSFSRPFHIDVRTSEPRQFFAQRNRHCRAKPGLLALLLLQRLTVQSIRLDQRAALRLTPSRRQAKEPKQGPEASDSSSTTETPDSQVTICEKDCSGPDDEWEQDREVEGEEDLEEADISEINAIEEEESEEAAHGIGGFFEARDGCEERLFKLANVDAKIRFLLKDLVHLAKQFRQVKDAARVSDLSWGFLKSLLIKLVVPKLQSLAVDFTPTSVTQRRTLLAQPKTPLLGYTGRRSMDVSFVNDDVVYRPGEDRPCNVCGRSAVGPRRSTLRLGLFAVRAHDAVVGDSVGGIASEQFDISDSKGALEFVVIMLGFLGMDEERLEFNPTTRTSDGKGLIEIRRDGRPERLIIDGAIVRSRCVAGRATTCWKAHLQDDSQSAFVIKDSWQYPERDDEGEILRKVTQQGVMTVARYYHHETVRIRHVDDSIRKGIRTGLDITTAVAPTVTADAVTTPNSTAATVMANAVVTATADSTAITAVVGKAFADDKVAPVTATTAVARRASASAISTASTIAVAAPRRRRSTAQQGKKTPRVQQLRQSESRSSKKSHGSANTDSTGGAGTKRRSS